MHPKHLTTGHSELEVPDHTMAVDPFTLCKIFTDLGGGHLCLISLTVSIIFIVCRSDLNRVMKKGAWLENTQLFLEIKLPLLKTSSIPWPYGASLLRTYGHGMATNHHHEITMILFHLPCVFCQVLNKYEVNSSDVTGPFTAVVPARLVCMGCSRQL